MKLLLFLDFLPCINSLKPKFYTKEFNKTENRHPVSYTLWEHTNAAFITFQQISKCRLDARLGLKGRKQLILSLQTGQVS